MEVNYKLTCVTPRKVICEISFNTSVNKLNFYCFNKNKRQWFTFIHLSNLRTNLEVVKLSW